MSMNSDITPFVFLKCKARLAETIAFVNVIIAGYTVDWSVERGGGEGHWHVSVVTVIGHSLRLGISYCVTHLVKITVLRDSCSIKAELRRWRTGSSHRFHGTHHLSGCGLRKRAVVQGEGQGPPLPSHNQFSPSHTLCIQLADCFQSLFTFHLIGGNMSPFPTRPGASHGLFPCTTQR